MHHQSLEKKPFGKVDLVLAGILFIIVIIIFTYFFLINASNVGAFQLLNLFFCVIITLIMVIAFYICVSRREKDINIDDRIVEVIK